MTASNPLLSGRVPLTEAMPALPPSREFLTSAGFAGAGALLAALIVAGVAVFAWRGFSNRHRLLLEQQERHHRELREDERRAVSVQECRERLAWVVDKGGIEPAGSEGATVGFGPELALVVLQGIHDDAQKLDDAALVRAAAVQLTQLSRVLAKQSGDLPQVTAVNPLPADPAPGAKPVSNGDPDLVAAGAGEDASPPAAKVPAGGRRRRQ